jgi:hypothetical protein
MAGFGFEKLDQLVMAENEGGSPAAEKIQGRRPGGSDDLMLESFEKSIEIRGFIAEMVEPAALSGSRVGRRIFIDRFDQLDGGIAAARQQNHPNALVVNRDHIGNRQKSEILPILIQGTVDVFHNNTDMVKFQGCHSLPKSR